MTGPTNITPQDLRALAAWMEARALPQVIDAGIRGNGPSVQLHCGLESLPYLPSWRCVVSGDWVIWRATVEGVALAWVSDGRAEVGDDLSALGVAL